MCRFIMSIFFLFFFKQKTAYEMRISDWSSDVCSSDLVAGGDRRDHGAVLGVRLAGALTGGEGGGSEQQQGRGERSEERRVGKSVSVRVDLGGRRIIKKKKEKKRQ